MRESRDSADPLNIAVGGQQKINVRFGDLHIPQDFIIIDSNVREKAATVKGLPEERAVYELLDYVCRGIEYPPTPSDTNGDLHVLQAFPYTGGALFFGPQFSVERSCGEFFQYPHETMAWEMGDCDDTAILLCALLRAYGIPPNRVWVAVGDVPGGGHAWVDLDGLILETTFREAPDPPYYFDEDYLTYWRFNDVSFEGGVSLVPTGHNRAKANWISQRFGREVKGA